MSLEQDAGQCSQKPLIRKNLIY